MQNGFCTNVVTNFTRNKWTHFESWSFVRKCVVVIALPFVRWSYFINVFSFTFMLSNEKGTRNGDFFFSFTAKVNIQGKGVVLTFKSWAHIKSHIKCWGRMGWVERAAIIGHTDSTCPYGEHVSVYVKILPLDHDYCWVQHYFYAYKIKIKLQRLFSFLSFFLHWLFCNTNVCNSCRTTTVLGVFVA